MSFLDGVIFFAFSEVAACEKTNYPRGDTDSFCSKQVPELGIGRGIEDGVTDTENEEFAVRLQVSLLSEDVK